MHAYFVFCYLPTSDPFIHFLIICNTRVFPTSLIEGSGKCLQLFTSSCLHHQQLDFSLSSQLFKKTTLFKYLHWQNATETFLGWWSQWGELYAEQIGILCVVRKYENSPLQRHSRKTEVSMLPLQQNFTSWVMMFERFREKTIKCHTCSPLFRALP